MVIRLQRLSPTEEWTLASQHRDRVQVEQAAKRGARHDGRRGAHRHSAANPVWEKPSFPTNYLPHQDVRTDLLVATGATDHAPPAGTFPRPEPGFVLTQFIVAEDVARSRDYYVAPGVPPTAT